MFVISCGPGLIGNHVVLIDAGGTDTAVFAVEVAVLWAFGIGHVVTIASARRVVKLSWPRVSSNHSLEVWIRIRLRRLTNLLELFVDDLLASRREYLRKKLHRCELLISRD